MIYDDDKSRGCAGVINGVYKNISRDYGRSVDGDDGW